MVGLFFLLLAFKNHAVAEMAVTHRKNDGASPRSGEMFIATELSAHSKLR